MAEDNRLQLVFNEMQEARMKIREINVLYKDELSFNDYREICEKIAVLKSKKLQFEQQAKAAMGSSWEELENKKLDLKQNKELISDLALSLLMKGETVKVIDRDNNEYEPKFSVKFTKTNTGNN